MDLKQWILSNGIRSREKDMKQRKTKRARFLSSATREPISSEIRAGLVITWGFSKLPNSSIRLKEALKNPSQDPWSPDAAMALSCLRRGNGGSSEPP
jgi:hypothetical protein